jgi:hypothetical protein
VGNQNHRDESAHPATIRDTNCPAQFIPEQVRQFVALLEVPFDSTLIEWRVTNTSKGDGKPRGQVIPYADQRAYTDRLNALCSPSGWTRKYTVHTSANFQRTKDQKTVAKIFVTCDLTIFGVGTHSATGEEWTDDDNAGTSAEAQAFKRACSCFGLGRYLYHFTGVWVDLDDRKRPKATPKLADWATPEGWKQGLRPHREADQRSTKPARSAQSSNGNHRRQNGNTDQGEHPELVRQVEAMADPLGKSMYRGLLKTVAQVWKPHQVQDVAVLQKLLVHMQAAERGLRRLDAAFAKTGANPLAAILHTLNLKTLDQVNDLESLHKVVVALEAKAGIGPQPS